MLVRHKNPTYSGTEVLNTVPFKFVNGVAEVPTLNPSRLASLAIKGWFVVDEPIPTATASDAAAAMGELAKPKRMSKKDYEIGQPVDPADMEQAEPGIG